MSTPERILDAAASEFAEHGFSGVRMTHVARRAGVNKALVYRHFGDKEGLYQATLRREITRRRAFIGQLPSSLGDMLVAWTHRQREDAEFIRLLVREGLGDDGTEPIDAAERAAYYRGQVDMLRELQSEGEIGPELDPECLFFALLLLTSGPVILPQLMGLSIPGDELEERWAVFLKALASTL